MSDSGTSSQCNPGLGEKKEQEQTLTFELIQRGDPVKPGLWHWRCRREDRLGNVAYGYIHADPLGRTIVPESFEQDRW
jgi:hypothetical protein